ncbi:PQQ-binding-like beta-propeller repeat protein [Streptomyces halstedii]|uniref:PQQ-binding-like beta-propeller repeat protein n=1 Tax=Streptomyces halstedii TaxID=1944 RepID=UPI0038632E53
MPGPDGGTERWSLKADAFSLCNGPAVLDGVLYASDSGRSVWAVDRATGRQPVARHRAARPAHPGAPGRVTCGGGVAQAPPPPSTEPAHPA